MFRILILTLAVALSAPVAAQTRGVYYAYDIDEVPPGPLRGQRADVAVNLPRYGYRDVDVRRLSNGQIAQISALIHSNRSEGDIRSLVASTLRGGALQRTIVNTLGRHSGRSRPYGY